MKNTVISGSNVTFGLLKDLLIQLDAGSKDTSKGISGDQLRAFLEHRNPFEGAKLLPYENEFEVNTLHYPHGFRIRSLAEQVAVLTDCFPGLDFRYVERLATGGLPKGAEGHLVIPEPSKVAEAGYHAALKKVLDLIATKRNFKNLEKGRLTYKNLRLTPKTSVAYAKLNHLSLGDVWVFPFQFGMLHRDHLIRRARVGFGNNEFGLGPYEVAILLLTHPDRISGPKQLKIDCAGCEYEVYGTGDSSAYLCFYWNADHDRLELVCHTVSAPNSQGGAVSGFLPQ